MELVGEEMISRDGKHENERGGGQKEKETKREEQKWEKILIKRTTVGEDK